MKDEFAPVKILAGQAMSGRERVGVLTFSLSLHVIADDLPAFHDKADSLKLCNVL
jgi:hypothetical protein